jgi:preprotein translocase subunit SecB
MADETAPNDTIDVAAPANGMDTGPAIGLISQYVKDLSFENPNAPATYQWQSQPQVDVQFNISSALIADGVHETVLKIEISSKRPEGTDFIVDLAYAGLFAVRNVPEDQVHAFMYAEAPRIIFPFARRVIADAVRDGGFAPLLLEPIDFNGLYLAQREQMAAQAAADGLDQPVGNA